MNHISQDFSPTALVAAIEANLFDTWKTFSAWPGAEYHDDPDTLWCITAVPFPVLNSVLRARFAPESVDDAIEATIDRYRRGGVPMLWWTGPATQPVNLGKYLLAHGLVQEEGLTGMAIDLLNLQEDLPTPPKLVIERVTDVEMLRAWSQVLAAGFDLPEFVGHVFLDWFTSLGFGASLPWHLYLGQWDGEPVASAALFLSAGVAGIYDVATLPEARRQGICTAITLTLLREARARGYRVGILHASKMGFNTYHKIGFREYCTISHYVWTGEADRGHGGIGQRGQSWPWQ